MADVSIDATISTSTARGLRSVVFTTASIGYWFCIDSTGTFGYRKTTDGGATWGSVFGLSGQTTDIAFDVWYDQWTPGDTGTIIHTWCFDTGVDDIRYTQIQTSNDTYPIQEAIVFAAASAVAGRGASCSGTKTASGYLYVQYNIDSGTERGLQRSTDNGATWGSSLGSGVGGSGSDQFLIFPAMNTGDTNDIIGIKQTASVDFLRLSLWDNSTATATDVATIQTMIENATDLTGQVGYSGAVRNSDGHIIVVSCSERDTVTADMQVFDCNCTSASTFTSTTKTDITTNIDDIYYPAVFIDQNTNAIYVAYNGKRDGSEVLGTTTKIYYTKSTDGGTTWTSGDTAYQEGATAAAFQVWSPISGPRFYVGWRVGTTLVGNAVNSINVTPSGAPPVDSYSETNNAGSTNQLVDADAVNNGAVGQAFTATAVNIGSAVFYLKKVGSPTGTAVARLYATSGTFGTSAVPTGSVLATSDTFTVSTLTTTFALITFTFSAGNQYLMTNGTKYAVMLEYTAGSSGNSITIGTDQSSPTHAGNLCYHDGGGYGFVSGEDVCFYVYSAVSGPVALPELILQPMTPATQPR